MKHDELIIKLYGIWHTTEGNAKDIIKEAIDAIEECDRLHGFTAPVVGTWNSGASNGWKLATERTDGMVRRAYFYKTRTDGR